MLALLDLDIVVYRCAFAAESTRYTLLDTEMGIPVEQFDSAADLRAYVQEKDLPKEKYTIERERLYEPLSHALANVKSVMSTIMDKTSKRHIGFLSNGKCYRSDLATMLEYKGNRKEEDKPLYYNEVREYLTKHYNTHVVSSVEADDALAIMQTDLKEDTVIVSIDKDLLQVPGKHYNWVQDDRTLILPGVGYHKLFMQVLSGDATDNIPGIRGIGTATARKLLRETPDIPELLEARCLDLWEEYLSSDKAKPVDMELHDGLYHYTSWNGSEMERTAHDIMSEVYDLVSVGDYNARKALQDSGESLPTEGSA